MAQELAEKIEKLCDDYCSMIRQPNGSLNIGAESNKYRLSENQIKFHQLEHDELMAAITGLTKTLFQPHMTFIQALDHHLLWSWCGEVLFGMKAQMKIFAEGKLFEHYDLFASVIRGALARNNHSFRSSDEKERAYSAVQNHYATEFMLQINQTLPYLTFPLLEGLLKRLCSSYVEMDGSVIQRFTTPNYDNGYKTYDPEGRHSKCSSIRDLLYLHYNYIADDNLKKSIDKFTSHLEALTGKNSFNLIAHWRNQSLHGSTAFQMIGTTILNYCLLLAIGENSADYNARRDESNRHLNYIMQGGYLQGSIRFYPEI